ncbi:LLM class flavin-dependent oxidoreductase [Comamonas terrae]|uniref:LLM class flavin-dependent oxidoreductase n=1 Tax=Comamonas terrae TaxID=673548 RepID=A0ABW5UVL6_9BURK|nr:LLM class flavin-dependent oxidoreductase [Comamonas terrae]
MRYSIFSVQDHHPSLHRSVAQLYEQVIAEAKLAESLGYDTFFVAEHHFHECGSVPNPAVFLAALARETTKIRLGVAVSNITIHNPLTIAEDYAMVDMLSGGRLTLGVGSGYLRHEFEGHRVSPEEKRERFDENLQVVVQALTGEPVHFQGKYNDLPGVALNVQPLQKDRLPIHVAIQRREAAYHVGRQGRNIFSLPYSCLTSFEEIRGLVEDYRKGYRESGAPGEGSAVLAFHCHVAETDEQAKLNAEQAFNLYLDTRLFYDTRRTYDTVVSAGLGMFGSLRTVADQLVGLSEMGIDHVMFLQNFGVLDSKLVHDSMHRIANEVMPEVLRRTGKA